MSKIVSAEDRHKVYELCKNQLSGKWAEVEEKDLIISPIADGLINKLFICNLPNNQHAKYNKVIIRLVDWELHTNLRNKEHSIAMCLLLSEIYISPKVLSVFESGTIMEFIDSRYFNGQDDLNIKTVQILASKLAQFHSTKLPISENSSLMKYRFLDFQKDVINTQAKLTEENQTVLDLIKEQNCQTFTSLKLADEFKWVKKLIDDQKSPIVFSHNDLNRTNVLIREKSGNNLEVFLIDFDWSNYNYRGIDFGWYFSYWAQNDLRFSYVDFPTDQQMLPFIEAYIHKMHEIFGNSYTDLKINSRETLIKESKVFTLLSFLKGIAVCLQQVNDGKLEYLEYVENGSRCYFRLKSQFVQ